MEEEFYMIFTSGHPVKSGIGPVSEFPSSHLQSNKLSENTTCLSNYKCDLH